MIKAIGKYKTYVIDGKSSIDRNGFIKLYSQILPFKRMGKKDRDKALAGEWEVIKKNMPKKAQKIEASE